MYLGLGLRDALHPVHPGLVLQGPKDPATLQRRGHVTEPAVVVGNHVHRFDLPPLLLAGLCTGSGSETGRRWPPKTKNKEPIGNPFLATNGNTAPQLLLMQRINTGPQLCERLFPLRHKRHLSNTYS